MTRQPEGARTIAIDRFSEDAAVREARQILRDKGLVVSTVVDDKREDKETCLLRLLGTALKIPPHRALALLRVVLMGVCTALKLPEELNKPVGPQSMDRANARWLRTSI